ncbi:MAG TPA: hypothetical protein VFI02_00240 [Armatimonadota bacterium]|nr:hypothetical protein [Armatimonadota bacterium]
MSEKDMNKEMAVTAEEAVRTAKEQFGITLDYSENSVKSVEEILTRIYKQLHPNVFKHLFGGRQEPITEQQLEEITHLWGAYIGEIIRKNHGGTWSEVQWPSEGMFTALKIGDDITVFPPNKVKKRLTFGDSDKVDFYYSALSMKIKEETGKVDSK